MDKKQFSPNDDHFRPKEAIVFFSAHHFVGSIDLV